MLLHCFLVILFTFTSLLWGSSPPLISSQCLTLDFCSASFLAYCSNLLLFSLYIIFLSVPLFPVRISSEILYSFCRVLFLLSIGFYLLLLVVLSPFFLWLVLCLRAWFSSFWPPIQLVGTWFPLVGWWLGIDLAVVWWSLNNASICIISFFFGSHDSDPYVIIGIIMVSTRSHMAAIFIPLNSVFPVSARISCVDACSFPFSALIWPSMSALFIYHVAYLFIGCHF